jgi:hypothetical protein
MPQLFRSLGQWVRYVWRAVGLAFVWACRAISIGIIIPDAALVLPVNNQYWQVQRPVPSPGGVQYAHGDDSGYGHPA